MVLALASLIIIHWFALITPGPDFLLVSQTAISHSRRESVCVVLGITAGVMVWAALALLGLDWLFNRFKWLQSGLFIAGGLYLAFIGSQMLRAALRTPDINSVAVTSQSASSTQVNLFKNFRQGFWTNLSNPKAIMYFSSVFSLFLNQSALQHWHGLLFWVVTIESMLWFMLVVYVLSLARFKAIYERAERWIDGVSGAIFIGFAVVLLVRAWL